MKIVIQELENYRGRNEQRYLIMRRTASRNGFTHVTPGVNYPLESATVEAEKPGWDVLAIEGFYQPI